MFDESDTDLQRSSALEATLVALIQDLVAVVAGTRLDLGSDHPEARMAAEHLADHARHEMQRGL